MAWGLPRRGSAGGGLVTDLKDEPDKKHGFQVGWGDLWVGTIRLWRPRRSG